jgi:hypothetical protein
VFGNSASGAYAEYLTVKPAAIVKKPSNLSFEEAASVTVAAQTASQGLFTHGRWKRDRRSSANGDDEAYQRSRFKLMIWSFIATMAQLGLVFQAAAVNGALNTVAEANT